MFDIKHVIRSRKKKKCVSIYSDLQLITAHSIADCESNEHRIRAIKIRLHPWKDHKKYHLIHYYVNITFLRDIKPQRAHLYILIKFYLHLQCWSVGCNSHTQACNAQCLYVSERMYLSHCLWLTLKTSNTFLIQHVTYIIQFC